MIVCKDCYVPMIDVMSFTKNKHEKFCRCPKCHSETKHGKINDDDLEFEKMLHIKMNGEIHR